MIWTALAGLAAILLAAAGGPMLGRRLPPAAATRSLAACAVVAGGLSLWLLACLGGLALAQVPLVAHLGHWVPARLRLGAPLWLAVAGLGLGAAAVAGAVTTIAAELTAWRRMRALVAGQRGELVVVAGGSGAFAVPGRPGHIVVGRDLLRALDADARRALIAHERAHLDHHHGAIRCLSRAAAGLNPALRPLHRAVVAASERWADEEAATAVGERSIVARAVAVAALHTTATTRSAALNAAGGEVSDRVRALLAAPPRRRLVPAVLLAALLVGMVGIAGMHGERTDAVLDSSHAAY